MPSKLSKIVDYTKYLSKISLAREPSPIRSLYAYLSVPGMISLGSGSPNASLFPFESFTFTLKDNRSISLSKEESQLALQYSATAGLPCLINWLQKLQKRIHSLTGSSSPDIEKWDICVTNGSQEGLAKAFEMLLDPNDSLLLECPSYSGSLCALRPMNIKFVQIETDKDGLNPDKLKNILQSWPSNSGPRPKILYTIPTGSNPTGASTSLERRKQIYQIARDFDLIILEDDPYYYMQFSDSLIPSYLSMDEDGRVIRFDSFSKILSAGLRMGFVTGPKPFIERICLHSQSTILHPGGLSQMVISKLLEAFSVEGFLDHAKKVTSFYKRQRDIFDHYAQKHLSGLAEWNLPAAGMFFWIRLNDINDTYSLVKERAINNLLLLVPGREFLPIKKESVYVRASFSNVAENEIDQALSRLRNCILQEKENMKISM